MVVVCKHWQVVLVHCPHQLHHFVARSFQQLNPSFVVFDLGGQFVVFFVQGLYLCVHLQQFLLVLRFHDIHLTLEKPLLLVNLLL